MSNVEVFDQKINEIKNSLDDLKKETSIEEKNKKTESAKEKINKTKEEINKRLDELKALGDETSLEEAKQLEEKLVVLEDVSGEITKLEAEVKDTNKPENEEKGRFKRQREGVTSKEEWKENRWTNVGRVAMGVGAVSVARRGIKKLFGIGKNKEKKEGGGEKTEKKSRWKKALLRGAGIGGGLLVWKNRGKIKEWLGFKENKLTVEEAVTLAEGELGNINESDDVNAQRGKLEYDATSQEIISYGGLRTKINKSDRKIEGFDLKFSDYKQLVHVANLINYMKFRYRGKGASANPFTANGWNGDIKILTKNGPDETKEEVLSGGLFSTLASLAPDVDGGIIQKALTFVGIKDGTSKDKFVAHINNIKGNDGKSLREQKDAPSQTNPEKDPVVDEAKKLQTEIEETLRLEGYIWGTSRGTLEAKKIEGTNKYSINTRQKSTEIEIKSSHSIYIPGLELEFKDVKEAIRVANLSNKLKYEYGGKCGDNVKPFDYEREWGGRRGLYVHTDKWRRGEGYHVRVLDDDTMKEKLPTIHADDNEQKIVNYLNSVTKDNGISFWTKA